MRRAFLGSVALLFLSLCLAGCQNPSGQDAAGAAHVHVRVGTPPPEPQVTAAQVTATQQRAGGIPPEVGQITLRVTTQEQPIPGSPFSISLETGGTSVDIAPNQEHRFVIEASNTRGEPIFRGTQTVTLPPDAILNLTIQLTAEVVNTPPQTQFVPATLGGDLVVTDPQSPVDGLRLRLFPVVLEQNIPLSITEVYNPPDVPILPNQTGIIVDIQPSGTVFSTPVRLAFPYDPSLVDALGLNAADLLVWRYDPVLGRWQPVPNQRVDTERQVVIAQLTSLSLYTVASALPAEAPPAPLTLLFQLDVSPLDDPLYRLAE